MGKQLIEIFSSFSGSADELIPVLQAVQNEFGYLSEESMSEIARFIRVPKSKVYGVATFYAQFRFTPIGKTHITVCRGTACHVRGSGRILENIENLLGIHSGEVTEDLRYSVETVACIGACGIAPCVMVNNKVNAKMTPNKVRDIIYKDKEKST
ncbi:MAG: NADH-quinone oxidoreductase subunit NuoE [Bacteroidota bacterium]|nr:NADH-quinone oxidoreductase subunit NuoE [Bacteroidota bacterium]